MTRGHAFRLHANIDLIDDRSCFDVNNRRDRVVFVGDVQASIVRVQRELLRVCPAGQVVQDTARGHIHDLNRIRVRRTDVETLIIAGQGHAAWPITDLDGLHNLIGFAVDDAERVISLVGDIYPVCIDHGCIQTGCKDDATANNSSAYCAAYCHLCTVHSYSPKAVHVDSARSEPRVSSSDTGCRNPSSGVFATTAFACTRGMR